MDKLWLIIKREYLNKVRNKAFIIMTFLSPLIFVGVILLISWLTRMNTSGPKEIAVLDDSFNQISSLLEDDNDTKYINLGSQSIDVAKSATVEAEYYGLLHILEVEKKPLLTLYSDRSPSSSYIDQLERIVSNKATEDQLIKKGIDLKILEESQITTQVILEKFSGEQTSKQAGWVKIAAGGAAGYLLMMFIIIYGNMVMRSVIEEKTNRIIEVIVSSVKPIYLMLGKIMGTSLAGITQFLIWVVLGGILLTVATAVLGIEGVQTPANQDVLSQAQDLDKIELLARDIAQLPILKIIICFFIYFIGGYFLYAAIYTAIGAAVDSETDTQQFMLPVILPLMLAIYVGFFSVIDDPNGITAVVFSYIPLTSPIVMLMRIPFGDVGFWNISLSILILYASILGVTYLAAKIYRIGILMYGKKTNWKELYKWLKY
ncbi:MAG: ABC transporter permease [Nonlabens sp.]